MTEELPDTSLREILEYAHKAREIYVQQEADRKLKRALRHKTRKQEMEEINVGEKVYYKKNKEDKWRGPPKVIGKDGKTVVLKQGSDVRETNRSKKSKKNGGLLQKGRNGGM